MPNRLSVTVITPEKVAWEGEADSLVLPAFDGQLGVLPGHAPLVAQMVPGVVQMRTAEQTNHLSVSGGFAEIFSDHVSLFAETAEMAEEIDLERARQAAERAHTALQGRREGAFDSEEAQAALRRALTRLKVAGYSGRHAPGRRPV